MALVKMKFGVTQYDCVGQRDSLEQNLPRALLVKLSDSHCSEEEGVPSLTHILDNSKNFSLSISQEALPIFSGQNSWTERRLNPAACYHIFLFIWDPLQGNLQGLVTLISE